jgi:hypothetical protein
MRINMLQIRTRVQWASIKLVLELRNSELSLLTVRLAVELALACHGAWCAPAAQAAS